MLIGVCGYAQHGKDTIANRLVAGWGYSRLGFADQLKTLALRVSPIIPLHEAGFIIRLGQYVEQVGWEEAKKHGEVRRFLQELGTGIRDIVHEDAWVHALETLWLESERENVVIPDVRFLNEAAWIKRHNGILIRVVRTNFENGVDPDHASERYALSLPANFDILNDGTVSDLDRKVDAVMGDIQEGFIP